MHEKLGDDALILLLNSRTDILKEKIKPESLSWVESTFPYIFHYAPPQILDKNIVENRELLVYY